uniref:DNA topoisomerase (ATP-hydrolyzing) n=1 Tax=Leptocylindrus danicus TaxID=163516 RepID=A0A7S2JZE7_9STRA|mmetsp:Transcript_14227/g.21039  ORF Transcript_14227/g.21039 Transcript_14227/m.21039 type:complete len:634 (+) Transcript_14227:363-2264(+)
MTDMDTDGSHIKGLIINFIHFFWPSLLECGFISEFTTPLLKARHGQKVQSFYSMQEYESWREKTSNADKYTIKYYKGLGTNTTAEALDYFENFDRHRRKYQYNADFDDRMINLVFDKGSASKRKDWILKSYDPKGTVECTDDGHVPYHEFINKELIHFSHGDNLRSIPSAIDGLKPSMRKILYGALKRKLTSEIKVAQLAGYISEQTHYHHGEASLQATIVNMAQDYVGSNNINILEPIGQFGTRLIGGRDQASPRYIFTKLSKFARLLFPSEDDPLLDYLEEDGHLIEPRYYCPIIPLALVNGGQGIGSGWSTTIPQFCPHDLIHYIRAKLNNLDNAAVTLPQIRPKVRGFVGEIIARPDGKGYTSRGVIARHGKNSLIISELPVGRWTSDYKSFLTKMLARGDITSFSEDHSTENIHFQVRMPIAKLLRAEKRGFHKVFQLESNLPTTNMHAFSHDSVITKYSTPEQMIDNDFFPVRLDLYSRRKESMMADLSYACALAKNKARFIAAVATGDLDIVQGTAKRKEDTISLLQEQKFDAMMDLKLIKHAQSDTLDAKHADEDETSNASASNKDYDYLLNMPLSSFSLERVEELNNSVAKVEGELNILRSKTIADLWSEDLDRLEEHLKGHMN